MSELPSWTATYRGYDDVALAAAASPGLVRRARGLLVSAPPSWVEQGAGVVLAHKQEVRLDGSGPAAARCACPAAGVCVHVVLACLFVHELVSGSDEEGDADGHEENDLTPGETEAKPASPTALEELTSLTPERATRAAGVLASRAVAARHAVLPAAQAGAETAVEPHRVVITWEGRSVVLVAGAGWGGILVPSGVHHQRAAELRLEAVVRARISLGLGWEWAEELRGPGQTASLTDGERELLASVRGVLTGTLMTGVARLDATVTMRLEAAATSARAHHLPELGRAIGQVSEAVRRSVAGSDAVSDLEVVVATARAWAFTRALEASEGAELRALRGRAREVTESDDVLIQPVGAWTWHAATGARGVTIAFLAPSRSSSESGGAVVHRSVAGRAHQQDPTFRPESAAIWGVPVRQLLRGTWQLAGVRLGDGAEVSSSDRTRATPSGEHGLEWIARCGVARWADLPSRRAPRLVGDDVELVLLSPVAVGKLRLDEVDQELVWPLVDVDGAELEVRLGVLGGAGTAADHLTRLAESVGSAGLRLRHVLVRRGPGGLTPVSAVVVRASGEVEVRSFTLGWPLPRTTGGGGGGLGGLGGGGGLRALRKALDALRARVERRPEEVRDAPAGPVLALCEQVRESCVDVAVSGRQALGDAERGTARELARRCGDLGLGLLADALARWAEEGSGTADPEAMLRVLLLADRAVAVA